MAGRVGGWVGGCITGGWNKSAETSQPTRDFAARTHEAKGAAKERKYASGAALDALLDALTALRVGKLPALI